jgi:hypothetical protein
VKITAELLISLGAEKASDNIYVFRCPTEFGGVQITFTLRDDTCFAGVSRVGFPNNPQEVTSLVDVFPLIYRMGWNDGRASQKGHYRTVLRDLLGLADES